MSLFISRRNQFQLSKNVYTHICRNTTNVNICFIIVFEISVVCFIYPSVCTVYHKLKALQGLEKSNQSIRILIMVTWERAATSTGKPQISSHSKRHTQPATTDDLPLGSLTRAVHYAGGNAQTVHPAFVQSWGPGFTDEAVSDQVIPDSHTSWITSETISYSEIQTPEAARSQPES